MEREEVKKHQKCGNINSNSDENSGGMIIILMRRKYKPMNQVLKSLF